MNKIIFLLGILGSFSAWSACPKADKLVKMDIKKATAAYQYCAVMENDEDAQIKLAQIYQNGRVGIEKDIKKTLLFYHLAADNGNALAQTKLAQLLLEMDETEEDREILASFIKQIKLRFQYEGDFSSKQEVLHPYILLLLASEAEGNKWYYPTKQKSYSEAKKLLESYEIDDEKKRFLLSQGSRWKQQKMMETAREILTYDEYQKFQQMVFPVRGKADPFVRQQEINKLKEKVINFLK